VVEVDPRGIEMAILDGIKELQMFQKEPVQRMGVRKIGMGSDDQRFRVPKVGEGREIRRNFAMGRVQKEYMPVPDGDLYSRDQKDPSFARIGCKVPVKCDAMMIGDGQDVEPFIGCFRNKFLCRVLYRM